MVEHLLNWLRAFKRRSSVAERYNQFIQAVSV